MPMTADTTTKMQVSGLQPPAAPIFCPVSKPIVIGLYGVPGAGKTYRLNQLEKIYRQGGFAFHEGSSVIAALIPGGLDAFKKLDEDEKACWRRKAIEKIRKGCADEKRAAVVTGHFMFWLEDEEAGHCVCTSSDLETYTHILYLKTPVKILVQRRLNDTERRREAASETHLERWQAAEVTELSHLCKDHGIFFSVLPWDKVLEGICATVDGLSCQVKENISRAKEELDSIINKQDRLGTVLLFDADRTLAPEDTGALFWKTIDSSEKPGGEGDVLKDLFGGPLGYSHHAFQKAALLYENVEEQTFYATCDQVVSNVAMYPQIVSLLHLIEKHDNICSVVITCGLGWIWERVLNKAGLSESVAVIGGGRSASRLIVTPAVKGALVTHLQNVHKTKVWAFGDSPLDLDMLKRADQAIVVVGEEEVRSKSMDAALLNAIENSGLWAKQTVLARGAPPRLNDDILPLVQLTKQDFLDDIFHSIDVEQKVRFQHGTDTGTSKLLMTPMRDATVVGPALRAVHRCTGKYLATRYLVDTIGLEAFTMPHVQGQSTKGFRLLHEERTLIVPLMRGGEPMAQGVSDAFPLAAFMHARSPMDIKDSHLEGRLTIILVDSVVNSGKTILQFVQHIRELHSSVRIVIVAGVIQAQFLNIDFTRVLIPYENLDFIALRLSANKYTGQGATDTGNRLFNTTHLP